MATSEMDRLDKQLLNILQENLPLVPRPFLEIAERLGISEEEVLERTQRLKQRVVRQISAIFDTRTLGYQSSLVAARVAPERLNQAARVFNAHPGVTHNYKRNHSYNLWLTIAVPPDSRLGLEKTVQILGEEAGVEAIRLMPTLQLFKIGVQLDVTGQEDTTRAKAQPQYTEKDRKKAVKEITELDKVVIRQLQKDLPVVSRPFDILAEEVGMGTEELLNHGRQMIEKGQMRRFSAVIYHRKAGFKFNGMGVWAVPEERVQEVGPIMASFKAVSHCYLRPTYSDWPYNIFTMVHARTLEECEAIIRQIGEETGITKRDVLYSTVEYKKTRLQYFTEEMEQWEEEVVRKLRA